MSEPESPAAAPPARASLLRTTLTLLPFQIVFRGGEALLPLLLAAWFGYTGETDAQLLFAKLFAFIGGAAVSTFQDSVFIPRLTVLLVKSRSDAEAFASALWARSLAAALLLGAVLAASLWLYLGRRLGGQQAAWLGLGYVAWLPAIASRALLVGSAHTLHSFRVYPAASGTGMLFTLALLALLARRCGIVALPFAMALGEWTAVGIIWFYLQKSQHFQLRPRFAEHAEIASFGRLAGHEVGGATLTRINPFVDQLVASRGGLLGGGTLLNYAFDVSSLPTSVAQAAFFPPLVSNLATLATARRWDEFRRTVLAACAGLGAALCVLAGLAFAFRQPLVRLLFLRGQMSAAGCAEIAELLPYALAGSLPFGMLLVLARAHVALQNTRIMVPLGVLNSVLNAVFNLALFPWIGLRGIALSTSLMQLGVAIAFACLLPAAITRAAKLPAA